MLNKYIESKEKYNSSFDGLADYESGVSLYLDLLTDNLIAIRSLENHLTERLPQEPKLSGLTSEEEAEIEQAVAEYLEENNRGV